MLISQADLDAYRAALREVGGLAARRVGEALSNLGPSRNAARQAAIEAITEAVGVEGDVAQALAGRLFDEVCAAEGIDATSELYDDIIDPELMARKVYYLSRALVEDDRTGFAANCSSLAEFYVHRCNYEAMVRNCAANNVRYARIPTGADTCDFCLMLASRGFVYHSDASASAGMHANCDCVVVPGRGGDDARSGTQIEGYDPDALYDLWQGRMNATASERARRRGTTVAVERMRMTDALESAARKAHLKSKWRWR